MKRTLRVIIGASPLIVGLLAAVVLAGGKGHSGGPPTCTDPVPSERQAKLLERFGDKGIDANKDGTLTCDEIKTFFEANPQLRPHHEGHGGPPQCTDPIPADKQAELLKQFGDKGIDADKNGTLTCAEVKTFFDANPDLRPHHGRHGGPPPCSDPIPADKQAELLKQFGDKGIDADKNGTLTCAEVKTFFDANPQLRPHHGPPPCSDPIPADKQAELIKQFGDKGIDADKNGTLTCAEVKTFFDANPQLRPQHCGPGGAHACTDPIPADKQAELLKKFGDKGIDANKDGTLTCAEVKAFFETQFAGQKGTCAGKHGHAGDKHEKGACNKSQTKPSSAQ